MNTKIVNVGFQSEPASDVGALTTRMQAGDEEAFNRFYEQYCDRLFRYLVVLCRGDEDLSRDLLQATMVKVARSMRVFESKGDLWRWLAAIARNNFIDAMRKAKRRPAIVPLEDSDNLTAEEVADDLWQAALDDALAGISAEDRALVEEIYFQKKSHGEVAARQDTTAKAIESKLARIRQKLRATILRYLRHENF
jgi:RNA polymerase sigma-70 factor (ECF subfamily)